MLLSELQKDRAGCPRGCSDHHIRVCQRGLNVIADSSAPIIGNFDLRCDAVELADELGRRVIKRALDLA